MQNRFFRCIACMGYALGMVAVPGALAQSGGAARFPDKPIRLMVPYAPGGNTDILARTVGTRLTEAWGKPVVVDNRGSANGVLASEISARAAPDGYTVFVGSTREISVNPHIYKNLPYDSLRDFAPVTQGTITPILLAVHPSFPVKSVKELIEFARTNPKGLSYGSPGIGTSMHLSGELLNMMAGIQTVHVPYNGGGPVVQAVVGGTEVKFGYLGMGPAMPHVKSGRLRPLALTISRRAALLPDVPTMIELGFKEFDTSIWFAFFVPSRTPKDIITKLNGEINRVLKIKEVNDFLLNTGVEVAPGTPEELARFVRSDMEKYGRVIRAANIKGE